MKFNLLLPSLIATEILAASAADPREGQGLRGANDPEGRVLSPFGNWKRNKGRGKKDKDGKKGKKGNNGRGPKGDDDNGGRKDDDREGPKRQSTGRVIISRKTEKKLEKEGKESFAIQDLRSRGMDEIKKKKVVFQSFGEGDFQVVEVGRGNERSFINSLMNGPHKDLFEYVEEDFLVPPAETTPNDPLLAEQYHHGLFQSSEAWDLITGSPDVTVAICDTGLQLDHPDLAANRLPGYHATQQCWEGDPDCVADLTPVHPHGTMCAGCAAAIGNNGEGVSGVGWGFKHRPGRVSDIDSGPFQGNANDAVLADCARRMCELPDVKVVGVSYAGVESPARRAAATYCKSQGALMVNAAGNDGRDLTQFGEADDDDLIVVGASTDADTKSFFSAYGSFVDVWAPGSSVLTATTSSGYAFVDGTSFSCPLVAGLIALIWSANPQLSPDEVEAILKLSTDNVGIRDAWNTQYGRINSYKAVVAAGSGSLPPTGSPTTPPPTPTPPPTMPVIEASFDGTSPRCTAVGGACTSGTLLNSRGTLTTEPSELNAPNTIDGCDDGNSGSYHSDESNDAITVAAMGSSVLQVGSMAVIKASVWAYGDGTSDTADFYVTEGDSDPTWSYIGSVVASAGGAQILESAPFELTSLLMTARVVFRYNGIPTPCSNGSYDDVDDLVFAVASDNAPPTPATPAPTAEPTPAPTNEPTDPPTPEPTTAPPTPAPTNEPTDSPTPEPTPAPTNEPTDSPTPEPTPAPTPGPNPSPATDAPTFYHCSQFDEVSCASAYGGGQCQWLGTCHNCGCVLAPRLG